MSLAPSPPYSKDHLRGTLEQLVDLMGNDDSMMAQKLDAVCTDLQAQSLKLDQLHTDLIAIGNNTDGAEGKLDTIHADLATLGTIHSDLAMLATIHADLQQIGGYTDQIEPKLDDVKTLINSTNTALATIAGYVDGIEGLITATNSKIDLSNLKLDGLISSEATSTISSSQTFTLAALGNTLVKNGPGKVYAFGATGIVEIRDNTTPKWVTVANAPVAFSVPLIFSTSIRIVSTLGAGISLQWS